MKYEKIEHRVSTTSIDTSIDNDKLFPTRKQVEVKSEIKIKVLRRENSFEQPTRKNTEVKMPKSKDMSQERLKKFLEKAKKNLQDLGKEAGTWMKKGELELARLSRLGKLELDTVKSNIKKEKLFKDIGKKVFELGLGKEIGNSAVEAMCNEVACEINGMKKRKTEISQAKKRAPKSNIKKGKKKK